MSLPRADKNFGQHFLINTGVIEKITDGPKGVDTIIEVGPGPAVLTKHLDKENLYLVEKDRRFKETLLEHVAEDRLFLADALDFDFDKIPGESIWLVSNLPYNVSAPLTIKFLQNPRIKYMSLMYQKEVAQKILGRNKGQNSLASLCQNYFEVKSLVKVSPGSFQPPPKVHSEVLSYQRKSEPTVPLSEFKSFEKFLRLCFREKRKTLVNNLKIEHPAEKIHECFERINLAPKVRAESLDLEIISKLYGELKKD